MTRRIAQQCLRAGIVRPHAAKIQRHCLRKYSPAAVPQPIEQQQQPSSPETKPKTPKSRQVLPQGAAPILSVELIFRLTTIRPPATTES
jgi:hypothetical protein